jgi:hypothetical protein
MLTVCMRGREPLPSSQPLRYPLGKSGSRATKARLSCNRAFLHLPSSGPLSRPKALLVPTRTEQLLCPVSVPSGHSTSVLQPLIKNTQSENIRGRLPGHPEPSEHLYPEDVHEWTARETQSEPRYLSPGTQDWDNLPAKAPFRHKQSHIHPLTHLCYTQACTCTHTKHPCTLTSTFTRAHTFTPLHTHAPTHTAAHPSLGIAPVPCRPLCLETPSPKQTPRLANTAKQGQAVPRSSGRPGPCPGQRCTGGQLFLVPSSVSSVTEGPRWTICPQGLLTSGGHGFRSPYKGSGSSNKTPRLSTIVLTAPLTSSCRKSKPWGSHLSTPVALGDSVP